MTKKMRCWRTYLGTKCNKGLRMVTIQAGICPEHGQVWESDALKEPQMMKYKCLGCGRDTFDRPNQPHNCRGGGFRKHGLTFVPVEPPPEQKCSECGHPLHQGQCYYHEAVTARRCDCNRVKPIDTGHPYDMSDLDSTEDIKPAQPEKRCHNCGHEITEHSEEGCMAYIRCDGACDTCGCTLTREVLNHIITDNEATKAKTVAMMVKAIDKPSSALALFQDQTVDLQTFAEELGFYRFFDGKESMTIAEIIEVAKQSLAEKTI